LYKLWILATFSLRGIGIYTSIFCNCTPYKYGFSLSPFSSLGDKGWDDREKILSSLLFFFSVNYRTKKVAEEHFLFSSSSPLQQEREQETIAAYCYL